MGRSSLELEVQECLSVLPWDGSQLVSQGGLACQSMAVGDLVVGTGAMVVGSAGWRFQAATSPSAVCLSQPGKAWQNASRFNKGKTTNVLTNRIKNEMSKKK